MPDVPEPDEKRPSDRRRSLLPRRRQARHGRGPRWTVPLAMVLGGGYGLLLAISLGLVLTFTATANFRNTYTLLNDKAMLVMDLLATSITGQIAPAHAAAADIAGLFMQKEFSVSGDDPRLAATLEGVLAAGRALSAVAVLDSDFRVIGVYRHKDDRIYPIENSHVQPLPLPDRTLMETLPRGSGPVWAPLRFIAGALLVSAVAPLESADGKRHGWVIASVTSDTISTLVIALGRGSQATTFLLDENGRVFAHSNGSSLGLVEAIAREQGPVEPADIGEDVLDALGRGLGDGSRFGSLSGNVNVREVEAKGQSYVVITRTLVGLGAKPWIAGVYTPAADSLDQIRQLYTSIIAALVMGVVAVVAALWIARRIARSVAALRTEADHIARLELDAARDVPRSHIAEFDSGARAFNNMLTAVRAFSRYVPAALVRRLMRFGFDAATRPERREAAVLFTDLAGFTTLSESLRPEEVAGYLNRHFTRLVACVEAEEGMVDKFLGDGMMAVWSAESPEENGRRALRAAVAMARSAAQDAATARAAGDLVLRLRIGVHIGPVIVGNLGAAERVNYTTIGDPVNVASRLEAYGKVLAPDADAVITASEDIVRLADDPAIRWERIGAASLRGRSGEVGICRILP